MRSLNIKGEIPKGPKGPYVYSIGSVYAERMLGAYIG